MSSADFDTPFSHMSKKRPIDFIPASTKSKKWQDIERGEEHPKDTQKHYFLSDQPKSHD